MNSVDQQYSPVFCLLAAILMSSLAVAGNVDELHVLKISAQDQMAVIRTPDGRMQIMKPGDILGTGGKVIEISQDRIVVENEEGDKTKKVIIRFVDGKQKTERIRKTAERTPALLAPAEKDTKAKKQQSDFQ